MVCACVSSIESIEHKPDKSPCPDAVLIEPRGVGNDARPHAHVCARVVGAGGLTKPLRHHGFDGECELAGQGPGTDREPLATPGVEWRKNVSVMEVSVDEAATVDNPCLNILN